MNLPPFKNNLRVAKICAGDRPDFIRIDVKYGHDLRGIDVHRIDELPKALEVLNNMVAAWPVGPFTEDMVRERLA